MCDFFLRSPTSVKSLAGLIWTARRYLNILSRRVRLVSEDVAVKVEQHQEQVRYQNWLFRIVSLQKCVATGTKLALLIACARVILLSSDAQRVVVAGGTMKTNTFKATRPCGILQAAVWAHVTTRTHVQTCNGNVCFFLSPDVRSTSYVDRAGVW